MNINGRKISSKYILILIFTALFFSVTLNSPANYSPHLRFYKTLASSSGPSTPFSMQSRDTVPRPGGEVRDGLVKAADTTRDSLHRHPDTLGYKISKDTLEAQIDYKATDSAVMEVPTKRITLYNGANVKSKEAELSAYEIQFDQDRNLVIARYSKDTAGNIIGYPKMVQADNTMRADSIVYNIKSQKGLTQGTYTHMGEMFVEAQTLKKITPEIYFGRRAIFTTCDLDTPHFAFVANKIKLINKKMAITGPIHPEFEGVPIPIYLPFGFFPLLQGRHSGILPPTFAASDQYGLGLEGLGYYKVVNDYLDFVIRTNLYSYGGWTAFFTPSYRKRYKYSGTLNFTMQNSRILADVGKDAYTTSKTFSLNWSHQVDSKARPGTTFGANVNIASTKFNQYVVNNPTLNYQNQLSSSITYSHTWDGKYNLSVSGTHSQNNLTRLVSVNLPNISFSAPTLYPLQSKDAVGLPKWYQKLGIGLTSTITGGVNFYDSLFNFKHIIDTFQWGAQNSIPITLALPLHGAIQIAPGISLSNKLYSQKLYQRYDSAANKVDTVGIQKGIFSRESMSFSLNLSTAIFGTFQGFGKNSKLMGIRHVIRPTLSISYTPDLAKNDWYTLTTPYAPGDSTKKTGTTQVSYFAGSQYGPFSPGRFGGMSFGLDNHIEIKVRDKKDTTANGIKKISIIDGFGFTGSYNYLADSQRLSPIGFYFRSTLFQKINITGNATLNPYQFDSAGRQTNFYAWDGKKFSLGKITSGTLSISTSFRSKPKDDKLEKEKQQQQQDQIPMTLEEQQAQAAYLHNLPGQFADFNIPWSLNLSFAFNYTVVPNPGYFAGFSNQITSSLNWSGDFNLTPKWKINMSGYYDVHLSSIQSLTFGISRDLHCWQMSINVVPVGYNHYFNITISPKAGILQDLRLNRTRQFNSQL
jgi:LPS-assembly protein